MKIMWFVSGVTAGIVSLSLSFASVPTRVTDDTAIYQKLSEIRISKEAQINFDSVSLSTTAFAANYNCINSSPDAGQPDYLTVEVSPPGEIGGFFTDTKAGMGGGGIESGKYNAEASTPASWIYSDLVIDSSTTPHYTNASVAVGSRGIVKEVALWLLNPAGEKAHRARFSNCTHASNN